MFTRIPLLALIAIVIASHPAEAQFGVQPSTVPAENFAVELGAVWWTPTPEIAISADGLAQFGAVDFVQEFGLENERFTEIRLVIKPARKHKLRFSRVPVRYNAETVLQRTISFGGRVFDVGLPAQADLEWDLLRAGYEWDFVSASHGFIGVIAELKYNRVKASIDSPIGSSTDEQKAPVPTIGGIARGYLGDYLSLTGEFTGLSLDRDDFVGKFYDLDLYAIAHLGRNLGVQAGYRSITVEYLVEGDEGDLKMKGPYFGAILRF